RVVRRLSLLHHPHSSRRTGLSRHLETHVSIFDGFFARGICSIVESLHESRPAFPGGHARRSFLSASLSCLSGTTDRDFSFGLAALSARRLRHAQAGRSVEGR